MTAAQPPVRWLRPGEAYHLHDSSQQWRRQRQNLETLPAVPPDELQGKLDWRPQYQHAQPITQAQPPSREPGWVCYEQQGRTSPRRGCYWVAPKHFPAADDIGDMIEALTYLTRAGQYKRISRADDQRAAFEHFWQELADGDNDVARRLIRRYYSRYEYANRNFTSLKPGWQTDRGMIYMVLGPPDAITWQAGRLIWFYKDPPGQEEPVYFEFLAEASPEYGPVYWLRREPSYRPIWQAAVTRWQKAAVLEQQ
jgi:GWxTD domain-containing protein